MNQLTDQLPSRPASGTASAVPRVLVVGKATPADGDLVGGLANCLTGRCELVRVETVEQALSALTQGRYAGVISDAGDFGGLDPDAVSDGERPDLGETLLGRQASQVLDTVGEGVLIVDADGQTTWMNRRMRQWPEPVRDQVRRSCAEAFRSFCQTAPAADAAARRPLSSRRYHLTDQDEHFLEVIASPVRDTTGRCRQVIAVVFDATGTRRLQQKIDAIDKAGAELVKIESEAVASMTLAERLKLLEDKVIRVTRDLMHFDHFNVRLIDPTANRLELVVANGLPAEALDIELMAEADANGISGYVAKTGRSYICPDVTRDPRYVTGLADARSSLTVPLTLDDQVIGIFNIESRRTAAFNEDDRQFAEIFGRYVAIALSILKLLVTERAATNKKVTDDVTGEIIGPLNDIALDAGGLLDDDDLPEVFRSQLERILGNVEVIRGSMRQAAHGPQTVLGTRDADRIGVVDPVLNGARVLVVDDEVTIRDVIAGVLRKHRMIVETETNGARAIDRLRGGLNGGLNGTAKGNGDGTGGFDLVLSDIRMPDKSGYDVFAAARRLATPPPVILMTGFGYDPNHCIVRASQEGLQAVLFKPFRVEQLLNEVRRAVEARQEQRSA